LEENKAWKDHCDRWNLPFRDESEVDDRLSLEVPSMLLGVWGEPVTVRDKQATYAPRFTHSAPEHAGDRRGATIKNGVLTYHVPPEWRGEPGEKEVNHAQ